MTQEIVYVAVDDRRLAFAVMRDSADPIVDALVGGTFPLDAVKEFWLHLMRENTGSKVIDVGAHLGTYAVPAAAAGADVIAVEGSSSNVELLTITAQHNELDNLEVLWAVAAAQAGTTAFVSLGPYGHIATAAELDSDTQPEMNVEAVTIDEIVSKRKWSKVDLVKIDVEGSELTALEGMRGILQRADGPTILIEANAHMLAYYEKKPADVLRALEKYGYSCYLIDARSPGSLVPVTSDDIQPECVADYLAVKTMPPLGKWRIRDPFSQEDVIQRVIGTTETFDRGRIHRAYGESLIEAGPEWLKQDHRIRSLKRFLDREDFSLGFRQADSESVAASQA